MAISLGGFRQRQAKEKTAREIAAQVEAERKKEGGLGGLLSLLSIPLAFATGGLSSAIFGTGAKSLLAGLGKAGIGAGLKGASESFLRDRGLGADVSKIKSTSKYGFGEQEAADIRRGMKEGISDRQAWSPESLLTSVVMDYAGGLGKDALGKLGGKLGIGKDAIPGVNIAAQGAGEEGAKKGLLEGFKDFLYKPGEVGLLGSKVGGGKGFMAALGGEKSTQKALADRLAEFAERGVDEEGWAVTDPTTPSDAAGNWAEKLKHGISEETSLEDPSMTQAWKDKISSSAEDRALREGFSAEWTQGDVSSYPMENIGGVDYNVDPSSGLPVSSPVTMPKPLSLWESYLDKGGDRYQFGSEENWLDALNPEGVSSEIAFAQGGQVPSTIADFFEMKGKSLGGSNKKSLAEMLGRK